MKNERREKILLTAQELFLHHGYQKVTLSDIAQEVGISRPTLYAVFENKEEIFKALIARFCEEALTRIEAECDPATSTHEQLMQAIRIWTIEPYEMLENSPRSEEFMDSCLSFASDAVESGYQRFEQKARSILAASASHPQLDSEKLAHLLTISLRGFKAQAKSVDELRELIDSLLAIILP